MAFLAKMTKEELEEQAGEFLHYAKKQLSREVKLRVQNRVDKIARGLLQQQNIGKQNPVTKSRPAATKYIRQKTNASSVCPPTSPRIGGFKHDNTIDWTHLDDVSPRETSSKCVQSTSRKRTADTTFVNSEQSTPPKRVSPDRSLCAHAVPVPMVIPLFTAPQRNLPYKPTRGQCPQTIVDLWNRLDIPGRNNTEICSCPACPYTTGAPLSRRFNLMVALVNLENWLWFNR